MFNRLFGAEILECDKSDQSGLKPTTSGSESQIDKNYQNRLTGSGPKNGSKFD